MQSTCHESDTTRKEAIMQMWLYIVIVLMAAVVPVEAYDAYRRGILWPSQILTRWGKNGIAFAAHGGMYGDFLLLPLVAAYIVHAHCGNWDWEHVKVMSIVGVVVATGNHLSCIQSKIPDPIGWEKEKVNLTIVLHFFFMSSMVMFAGMFYISPDVSVTEVVFVSVVLGIHMAFGTHVPLGLINRWIRWTWCPDLIGSPGLPRISIIIWMTLSGFSTYAAGWCAGVIVAFIGCGFALMVITLARISPPPLKKYGK